MSNWLTSITDLMHQLTHRLHHLLAPPGATCLTCGTRATLSSIYPGICARCVKQIPWIRSIRCLRCGRGIGCPDCVRPHMQSRSFICNRSAVQYNAMMKDWIGMYKFRGHARYEPLLTSLLIQAFQAMSEELNPVLAKETLAPMAHPATLAQNQVHANSHPPSSHASTYAHVQPSAVPATTLASVNQPGAYVYTHAPAQPHGKPAFNYAQPHPEATTHCLKSLPQHTKPRWRPDAVTYVPVSDERLAERGFNQAERLAAGLATVCRLPIVDLLQRRINTTKQSFKTRSERIQTMQDAFAMQPGAMELMIDLYRTSELPKHRSIHQQLHSAGSYVSGARSALHLTSATAHPQVAPLRLLLIDDIYTTGSTLDACGRVILNAGRSNGIPIEVYTLTLARS